METLTVSSVKELMDVIGAGNPDPRAKGPVVVKVKIWDGRIVRGSYYRGPENPHVISNKAVITDNNLLLQHVQVLLSKGSGFIVRSGQGYTAHVLKWTISDN